MTPVAALRLCLLNRWRLDTLRQLATQVGREELDELMERSRETLEEPGPGKRYINGIHVYVHMKKWWCKIQSSIWRKLEHL